MRKDDPTNKRVTVILDKSEQEMIEEIKGVLIGRASTSMAIRVAIWWLDNHVKARERGEIFGEIMEIRRENLGKK